MKTFLQGLTGMIAGIIVFGGAILIKETLDTIESCETKIEETNENVNRLSKWLSTQSGYVERHH